MLNSFSDNFEKSTSVSLLKFRWFLCNSYQFELPGGKRILMDPFLPENAGYKLEDYERVDYIILNHTHTDHVGALKETYKTYKPKRVFCHSSVAYEIAKDKDVPQRMIFPFENEKTYRFNDFTLQTITGRHGGSDDPAPMSEVKYPNGEATMLNKYGALYNTNFIITTNNNFRIYFCSGTFDENERHEACNYGPDIMIRQCSNEMLANTPEVLADEFMMTGARILLPLHHEKAFKTMDTNEFAAAVNTVLSERGYAGRMVNPKSGCWYGISSEVIAQF